MKPNSGEWSDRLILSLPFLFLVLSVVYQLGIDPLTGGPALPYILGGLGYKEKP